MSSDEREQKRRRVDDQDEEGFTIDAEEQVRWYEDEDEHAEEPQEAVDEVRTPKIVCRPDKPTKEEWDAHQATHWPFRSWCPHCVAGRAIASPHTRRAPADREFQEDRVPTISLDHCFLGEYSGEKEERKAEFAWLIAYDSNSEAFFALPTGTKEAKEWVIVCLAAFIDKLGYSGVRVGLKSDNAKELLAIKTGVALLRTAPTTPISVPVRESKANGACEKAVRTWEGQYKTFRHHLTAKTGDRIPRAHPIWQWCGHWAGNALTRVRVQGSGRTAYERITSHRMKAPLACFGEKVVDSIMVDGEIGVSTYGTIYPTISGS